MIRAILFDADGVIQRSTDFRARLAAAFGILPDDAEELMREIWAVEIPALVGAAHFPDQLASVCARRGLSYDETNFFAAWLDIRASVEILAIIADLRLAGIHCALTSNQERRRAEHMSSAMGYATLFDAEYYSCYLGHAKPSAAYFEAVLHSGGYDPATTLFIDDRLDNVAAAEAVGLHAALFDLPESAAGPAIAALLHGFGLDAYS